MTTTRNQDAVTIDREILEKAKWLATFALFNLRTSPTSDETPTLQAEIEEYRDKVAAALAGGPADGEG